MTQKKRTKKKAAPKKPKSLSSGTSKIVAIVSDIHFDMHDEPTWRAFRKWHADVQPHKTIFDGDFVELNMLSRFTQHATDPLHAVDQIKCCITEVNPMVEEADEIVLIEGNHENRWGNMIAGVHGPALKQALGLTLREQFFMQGLDPRVTYLVEDLKVRGVQCGPFLIRHGDKQVRGRNGGGKHLAANKLTKSMGESEIFGHFHRAQMFCQTSNGKTAVAIANPCMTGDHAYSLDPDWQRGFTVIELYGPDNQYATARPILIQDGHFAYNGKVYDGNV